MEHTGRPTDEQQDMVVLPEDLTIAQSCDVFELLMRRAAAGGDIHVDADSVSRVDAAGIQLLFVVRRALGEAGHTLQWTAASEQLRGAAALLGMTKLLGLSAEG